MNATKENFKEETSKGLVLVDFWAEWCGPCQGMMPVLDQLAETGVKVVKVNVEKEPELGSEYRVMSIPRLLWMKDGEVVDDKVGAQSLETLIEISDKYK